jgi:hypothetical protein
MTNSFRPYNVTSFSVGWRSQKISIHGVIADKPMYRRCRVAGDGMVGRVCEVTGETCSMISESSRSQSPRSTVRRKCQGDAVPESRASDPELRWGTKAGSMEFGKER